MKKVLLLLIVVFVLAKESLNGSLGISYKRGKYGTDNETTSTYFYGTLSYKFYPFSISISVPYIKTDTVYKYTNEVNNNNNDSASSSERNYDDNGNNRNHYYKVDNNYYDDGSSRSNERGSNSNNENSSQDNSSNNNSSDDESSDDSNTTKTNVHSISGIGDMIVKFSAYSYLSKGVYLKNSVGVKLPTAKKDLGTGQTDYILEAQIYKIRNYRDMIFYTLGYTITGDATNKEYKDYLYTNIGMVRSFSFFRGGVKYSYTQSTREGVDDAHSISMFAMINNKITKVNYFYSMDLGLTEGAPKFAFSIFVSFPIE